MKYKCVTCRTIIIITAYNKSFKNESYSCPLCGDMMLYKPNNIHVKKLRRVNNDNIQNTNATKS